jgi:hypothetical protein
MFGLTMGTVNHASRKVDNCALADQLRARPVAAHLPAAAPPAADRLDL